MYRIKGRQQDLGVKERDLSFQFTKMKGEDVFISCVEGEKLTKHYFKRATRNILQLEY